MLIVYTPHLTSRLEYIFNLLLNDMLGLEYKFTHDIAGFKNYTDSKISYAPQPVDHEIFFKSTALLFENTIIEVPINVSEWKGLPVFFQTNGSEIPFDLFAASFYLVSRYEEYMPFEPDIHGRYQAINCLAYKNGFLHRPVVNHYAGILKNQLSKKFADLKFAESKTQFISTVDIDNAYAYTGKGIVRTTAALTRSLIEGNFNDLKKRTSTVFGKSGDPFDTYHYYFQLQEKYGFKSIFFFLVGNLAKFDRNLPHTSKQYLELIKQISFKADIGLHPSYSSSASFSQLKIEKDRLENSSGKKILNSRQHFLKLQLPDTYKRLLEAGITDDYSMGFADQVGFRAGICSTFNFFDLHADKTTTLKVHPFAIMDGTLNQYMKLNIEEAKNITSQIINEIKSVNGTFISLWHNETLSETGIWKGWRSVFEYTLQCIHTTEK